LAGHDLEAAIRTLHHTCDRTEEASRYHRFPEIPAVVG
jgi:hypothetical protein